MVRLKYLMWLVAMCSISFASAQAMAQSMKLEKSPFGGFEQTTDGVQATVLRLGDVRVDNRGVLSVTPTPTFSIKTGERTTDDWRFSMSLTGFGRDITEAVGQSRGSTHDWNRIDHDFGPVVLRYDHKPEGLEQSIVVSQRPNGPGELRVAMTMPTTFDYTKIDERTFDVRRDGKLAITFSKLKVLDATGKELSARVELIKNVVHYVVDDKNAAYPILIDPLATTPNTTLTENGTVKYGFEVVGIGDVNDDTFSDVLVGEIRYSNGENREGRALIYNGSANGVSAMASWTVESDGISYNFGRSASAVGDVNGDDYDDFLVGAAFGGGGFEGEAYFFLGGPTPDVVPIWSKVGVEVEAYSEYLTGAGDLNCDGVPDIAISGYLYDGGGVGANFGRVEVFYGDANAPYFGANADLELIGTDSEGQFGNSISRAGNVNGDTGPNGNLPCGDLLIGSSNNNVAVNSAGAVFLYAGDEAGLNPNPVWTVAGGAINWRLGTSVHGGYDVNNDGYDDVLAGGFLAANSNGDAQAGRAQMFLGAPAWPSVTPDWEFEGEQAMANFGRSARFAGDLDGNGFVDIVIGAPGYTVNVQGEGAVFGFMNGSGVPELETDWRETEGAQSEFGFRANPLGDVNGDGYDDVAVAANAAFTDNAVDLPGVVYIYHGVQTCTIDGSVYPDGTANPLSSCQTCDVTQSTTAWVQAAVGTACGPQTCNGDDLTGDQCDANGACTPGGTTSCGPFTCDAANDACFGMCVTDAECASGITCNGMGACLVEPMAAIIGPATADCETAVMLDGSTSTDPGGATLTYAWAQTAGTDVLTGVDITSETLTFTTPTITADETLSFTLTVSNGAFENTTTHDITISACQEPGDDEVDMGINNNNNNQQDTGGTDPKVSGGGCADCATAPTDGSSFLLFAFMILGLLRIRRRK